MMPGAHDRAYPITFTFRDDVNGVGFLARVTACGRALIVNEGDGWWLYGVEPGGMAASGETASDAHIRFRRAFTKILFDIAGDARDLSRIRASGSIIL